MGRRNHEPSVPYCRDFIDHHKTVALADALTRLGVPEPFAADVVWGQWSRLVFHLWDVQSEDGELGRLTPSRFARIVAWHDPASAQGLWDAWMAADGFIDDPKTPEARLHDYGEAVSRLIERRADAEKKRLERGAVRVGQGNRNLDSPRHIGCQTDDATGRFEPPFQTDETKGKSKDCPETVRRQSGDSPRIVPGQSGDSPQTVPENGLFLAPPLARFESNSNRIDSSSGSSEPTATPSSNSNRIDGAREGGESGGTITPEALCLLWMECCPDYAGAPLLLPKVMSDNLRDAIERERGRDWRETFKRAHRAEQLRDSLPRFEPKLGWIVKPENMRALDAGYWDRRKTAPTKAQQRLQDGVQSFRRGAAIAAQKRNGKS